jgi:hypothetical protein
MKTFAAKARGDGESACSKKVVRENRRITDTEEFADSVRNFHQRDFGDTTFSRTPLLLARTPVSVNSLGDFVDTTCFVDT